MMLYIYFLLCTTESMLSEVLLKIKVFRIKLVSVKSLLTKESVQIHFLLKLNYFQEQLILVLLLYSSLFLITYYCHDWASGIREENVKDWKKEESVWLCLSLSEYFTVKYVFNGGLWNEIMIFKLAVNRSNPSRGVFWLINILLLSGKSF